MPDYNTIIYEVDRARARITLNRPEKLNALSMELQRELNEALVGGERDNNVHSVILRGAGRAFSAGYDITPRPAAPRAAPAAEGDYTPDYRGGSTFDDDAWRLEESQRLRMALFDMHKPVIAQIHGYCIAGGTDVALLCDMIVSTDDCVIGFPPARSMGALPNQMWLYNIGPQWAKRLLLSGDTITGAEAATIGLVLKAVPPQYLESEVEGIVDPFAMIDTDLLAANKRIVNVGLELMGARTLQRMAAENDARAHLAPSVREFARRSREEGLKAALHWRDGKFGDGRARVDGPEIGMGRASLTVKATSLVSVVAIWAAIIPAVIIEPDGWWAVIFAGLATMAVGIGFWRRLGLSRVFAIAGIWACTAIMIGDNGDTTWTSIMAFLAMTSAIVYSFMRRDAFVVGLGIAFVWLATATVVVATGGGSWIAVFAFLTAATTAGTRSRVAKGVAAMVWWGIAAAIMLAADGQYGISVIAWLLASASLGFGDIHFPRRIEWDFLEREDEREVI